MAVKNKLISKNELDFLRNLLEKENKIETNQRNILDKLNQEKDPEQFEGSKLSLFNELKELYDDTFINEKEELDALMKKFNDN